MTFEQFVAKRERMSLEQMIERDIFSDYINDFRDQLDAAGVRECLVYPGPIFIEVHPAGPGSDSQAEQYHLQLDSDELHGDDQLLGRMESLCYSFVTNEGLISEPA